MSDRSVLTGTLVVAALLAAVGLVGGVAGLGPLATAAAGAIAVPLLGVPLVVIAGRGGPAARRGAAVAVATLTAALSLVVLGEGLTGSAPRFAIAWLTLPGSAAVSIDLVLDPLGTVLAAVAGVVGALVVLFSTRFMERESNLDRYYALTLLFVGGMIAFALVDGFVALYVFWEVLGLCSLALIAFWLESPTSRRAGLKAFVVTRFGDIGLLAGIAVLVADTGTFSIAETITLASEGAIPEGTLALAGALFVLAAVGKSAQLPLFVWLPDAMEAPTTSTALIHAACMVNAGVYLLARTIPIFEGVGWYRPLLMGVGAATALAAALLATVEWDFKRALAYCTISQLGYVTAAVGLSGGLVPAAAHLASHSVFKALLFLGAGAVIFRLGGSVHKHVDMREARGVGALDAMPVTNLAFLVGIAGLAGVPPFNGFWSKELIFGVGLAGGPIERATAAVLIVTAVLTVGYGVRIYALVFTRDGLGGLAAAARRLRDGETVPLEMAVALGVLAIGTLTSWLVVPDLAAGLALATPGVHTEIHGLGGLLEHVLTPRTAVLTVGILGAGLGGWIARETVGAVVPGPVRTVLDAGYGIDRFVEATPGAYEAVVAGVLAVHRGGHATRLAGLSVAILVAAVVLLL
ncbi:NADH-quinone oxidoreductase subunit 5 family protein [Halococcoides cellulosivorans]|uniref:NADH-quinone oxidoreductase subunit 5 family protein n=1 Tax=Halococcoides cellulosivorans TaxID=1679096 RepID=UPI00131F272B|nr:NADH-quinone oxidoreductase subunit L [Halococcoides cellulosivorans]